MRLFKYSIYAIIKTSLITQFFSVKKQHRKRTFIYNEKGLTAFAENFRTVRKLKGYTQEKLSHDSGITLSQIARIETVRANPTLSTIFQLAKTLEIPVSDLFNIKF